MSQTKPAPVGRPPTIDSARTTILTHATRLFAEHGFEQTTLQEVGSSVGLSKAAVYHYFESKQDMYDEIVVGLLDGLLSHVKKALRGASRDDDPIAVFMKAHAAYFEDNLEGFVTLFHGVGGLQAQQRSARQIKIRDRYEKLLRELLAQAAASGRLKIDDVALTAKGILSMLNWMSRWYKPGGARSAVQIAEQYYKILYNGLRADA
jgi:AcrR family transcriptional regulator